jgi:DGQHR domain-containing protein
MAKTSQISERELIKSDKPEGSPASFPALQLTQNNHRFYFATMPAEDIFPYCFVAGRNEDPIQGFQRTLSGERARDIAKYLDQSQGSIPTNIVLSAQEIAQFSYNSKTKSIRYKRFPKAFLVLDGQHRLYGYGLTKKKHRVPVAIYEGLSRTEEAGLFIDINTNQRGVPAALLLDIKQVAEQESENEIALRKIFDQLNLDPQSPLNGYLSAAHSAKGKISRVTFNRSVVSILNNPVILRLSMEKQYELIRNYFIAVENGLRNPGLLRKQAYFEAFCEFFHDVIRLSRETFQNYRLESLTEVLVPLRNVDLENLPTYGKTLVSKSTIIEVLKNTLSGQIEVTDDMV